MSMDRIVAFAVIASLLGVVLKQTRPDMAMALTLFAGAALLMSYAAGLWEAVDAMNALGARAGLQGGLVGTLCKVLGVALLGEFGAQVCRDAGQGALACKVELGARLILTLMALPMLTSILDSALRLSS